MQYVKLVEHSGTKKRENLKERVFGTYVEA
jgi:hypothetical protein